MTIKTPHISKGAWFMFQSVFWFALMNVSAKMLKNLPPGEIVFFRCSGSMLLSYLAVRKHDLSLLSSKFQILFVRGIVGTTALLLYFATLQKMPLGTAVTIQYISPIFAIIIAMIFYKEKVRLMQWIFFALSFAGVILIKGFEVKIELTYFLFGLVSALLSGVVYNLIRVLNKTENAYVIVFYFMLVGTVAGLISMFFSFKMPHEMEWIWAIVLAITTQLGQVNMTRAYQTSMIKEVTIINYLGIIYALAFGFFVFDETLSLMTIFGIGLVLAGVISNVLVSASKAISKSQKEE